MPGRLLDGREIVVIRVTAFVDRNGVALVQRDDGLGDLVCKRDREEA